MLNQPKQDHNQAMPIDSLTTSSQRYSFTDRCRLVNYSAVIAKRSGLSLTEVHCLYQKSQLRNEIPRAYNAQKDITRSEDHDLSDILLQGLKDMNKPNEIYNELYRIHAYATALQTLAQSGDSRNAIAPEHLEQVFADIAKVTGIASAEILELLGTIGQGGSSEYKDPYDQTQSEGIERQEGLEPFATFTRTWTDGTTYKVRVPRERIHKAEEEGDSLSYVVNTYGEVI